MCFRDEICLIKHELCTYDELDIGKMSNKAYKLYRATFGQLLRELFIEIFEYHTVMLT